MRLSVDVGRSGALKGGGGWWLVGVDGFDTHALEGVVVGLDGEDGGAGGVCAWPRC